MSGDAADLQRLSALLDAGLNRDPAGREAWLDGLQGEDARLRPALRRMLDRDARGEFDAFLEEPAALAVAGSATPASDFHAGDVLGPYRLLRPIGRGGMGEVWLATRSDGQLKRAVALKLPTVGLRRSLLVQRFERERDILAALIHPCIARLYDAGLADNGQPYMALEYVQGAPITQAADSRALDVAGRVRLLRQVMDAVQYAHANLVVHRDLKPGNVLVTTDGEAKLLDFGIAKLLEDETGVTADSDLTRMGGRALTLRYAAPELVAGGPVTTAVDVWALGVLLYELLAGRRPFGDEPGVGVEQAILYRDPARPSQGPGGVLSRLSRSRAGDLDTIVLKALKKDTAARYPTVGAFADDLDRWLRGEPVLAQPDRWGYRLRRFVGRHRWATAATALASVALLATASVAVVQGLRAQQESARALAARDFMVDLFQQTDPDLSQGKVVSAKELLLQGHQQVLRSLPDQPLLQAELLHSVGLALWSMFDLPAGDASLAEAAARFQRADRPREAAAVIIDRAALRLAPQWQVSEALQLLDAARAAYPEHADDAEFMARHAAYRTFAANVQGDVAARATWYAEVLRHADAGFAEPTSRTVLAVRLLTVAETGLGQHAAAVARLEALLAQLKARPAASLGNTMAVLVDLGSSHRQAGRYLTALKHHDEARALCRSTLDAAGAHCVYNEFHRANVLLWMGRERDALSALSALLPPAQTVESAWAARRLVLAFEVLERAGRLATQPDVTARVNAVADAEAKAGEDWRPQMLALTARTRQLLREGQVEAAQALSLRAMDLIRRRGLQDNRGVLLPRALHALVRHARGEHQAALDELDAICAVQTAAVGAEHPSARRVCLTRVRPLQALGRTDEALRELERALPVLREAMGGDAPLYASFEALRAELSGPPPATDAQRRTVEPLP